MLSAAICTPVTGASAVPVPLKGMGEPGDVSARLRLYEGFRDDMAVPEKVISSYYLKPLVPHEPVSEVGIQKEIASLKRVFNMERIKLVTDAAILLKENETGSPFQVIVLNGRKLLLQFSPVNTRRNRFKVEVFDDGDVKRSLFRSRIILPQKKTTAVGFEDSAGKIYFLSFQRSKDLPILATAANPGQGPATENKTTANYTVQNPMRVKDPVKQPRLLKRVSPKYPKTARMAMISGKVVVDATTDPQGNVAVVHVVEGPELLRKPSIEAIKQWKYEPYILEGKACPVKFTVVISFRLDSNKKKREPVNLSSDKVSKLIRRVEPKYPKSALKKGISGIVVAEAITDTEGNIMDVTALEGHELLVPAALEAIKQWKYEPYIIKGKKCAVRFTVIVKFKLRDKNKKGKRTAPKGVK